METIQSQKDIDTINELREIVKYGTVMAQHPRDTNERHWAAGNYFALWLYPGECVLKFKDRFYVVGVKFISMIGAATPPKGVRWLSNGNGWAYSPERCVYGYWAA